MANCDDCPPGTFDDDQTGSINCANCAKGHYNDKPSRCFSCGVDWDKRVAMLCSYGLICLKLLTVSIELFPTARF